MEVLNRFRNLATNKAIPLQASLELTYRCNERCTHCYIDKFWDDPSKVLSKDDWFTILDKLRGAGSLYLILMGGEAMLNPYFWDILEYASQIGFHASMITNGLKIQTVEVAEQLKRKGLKVATVSLYSMDPNIHDSMTTISGSHKKTLRAIELLRQAGIEVGVNCLLTERNIEGYFEVVDWCIANNIQCKEDTNITAKFNGDKAPTFLRATSDQLINYYRERARRWPNSRPTPQEEQFNDYACNIAKGKCAVNPYGDLLGCIEIRKPLGSLLHHDFETLWQGLEAKKWRSIKLKDIKGLEGHAVLNSSHDGCSHFCEHCLGMALHESGDPLVATQESLRLANIKKQIFLEGQDNKGNSSGHS